MADLTNKTKKLSVRDLKISFRTQSGKVQAVRNISFDLYKGETLAIVGESGSGKSVTSRAIMGILAGNAIVEGGEILYEGKDLMKISESEFHEIRGDKIAMVFQDPLSSLNPIMRIGRQLTEAMLLKNRASRNESRRDLNRLFDSILTATVAAAPEETRQQVKAEFSAKIARFKKFTYKQIQLEKSYRSALDNAKAAVKEIVDLRYALANKIPGRTSEDLHEVLSVAAHTFDYFVVMDEAQALHDALSLARIAGRAYLRDRSADRDPAALIAALDNISGILTRAIEKEEPNLFGLGYYLTFVDPQIPDLPVPELNALTHQKLDDEFMLDFIAQARSGVEYAAAAAQEARKTALARISERTPFFADPQSDAAAMKAATRELADFVRAGINPVSLSKDSASYTFEGTVISAIETYKSAIGKNEAEQKRFEKQTEKRQKLVDAGKTPTWEVAPADYLDLDDLREQIVHQLTAMAEHLERQITRYGEKDYQALTVDMIDYFKAKAAASVDKLTKAAAKNYAIDLMGSVGIPDPRRRYRQYPFEFSGGMRQRIVIAIALTANPDILICDEPTTALDVTIQAQILELINRLKAERDLSIIFITHDLGVVANMADRIAVMYAGKIVEYGTAEDVFYSPAHPYTWALLSSVPDLDTNGRLESIPGTPPNMIYPPKGDAFAPRNKYAMKIDFEEQPPMFRISDTHYAATWLLHPNAPKLDPPAIITERIARMKQNGDKRKEGGADDEQ